MSTLITGGTVVTATGTLAADVLIVGEKIAALGQATRHFAESLSRRSPRSGSVSTWERK